MGWSTLEGIKLFFMQFDPLSLNAIFFMDGLKDITFLIFRDALFQFLQPLL